MLLRPQYLGLVGLVLRCEVFHRRHGDDTGGLACRIEPGLGGNGDLDLGTRCKDHHLRRLVGRSDLIGTPGAEVFCRIGDAGGLQFLAGERQHRGACLVLQRQLPALGCLHRVAGAVDGEVGDDAECGHVLHRLVGRAVLAKSDRVMRHHIDDARLHEGGQPDRRAAVIGEDKESAAIGDDPSMQRHAVHGCRHAMLADAVIDVAAAVVGGGQWLQLLRLGVVGAGEVGRTADGFRHRGIDHVECILRGIAGGECGRVLGEFLLVAGDHRIEIGGQLAGGAAGELFLFRRGGEACSPGGAVGSAARSGLAPGVHQVVWNHEGFVVPAQRLAGAGDFLRAER